MGEIVDLSDFFAKAQCYCLNQSPSHPFTNLFVGDETLYLQSDVDEQLLINIVFRTTVKIHSIRLVAPDEDSAPVGVKLFANLQNPGFSDVEDLESTQKISLREQDLLPDSRISLKLVKFLHVNSLTFYFDENRGSDLTVLSGLKIFGQALDCVNVAAIHERKEEG